MLTDIKHQLAQCIVQRLKIEGLQVVQLENLFQRARNPEHGHLAWPVFSLASQLKQKPAVLAQQWAEQLQSVDNKATKAQEGLDWQAVKVSCVGGFINFHFSDSLLQQSLKVLQESPESIGYCKKTKNSQNIVIDFASPNVAKPMHIGHLRASLIGQAIVNLAHTQGHPTVALNHLGDWGVQFGKLIWAYKQWNQEQRHQEQWHQKQRHQKKEDQREQGENLDLEALYTLYVRFHKEAKNHPDLDALGSAEFKKLEQGDAENLKLWRKFVDVSMREYNKLWGELGIGHDKVLGESFYNDQLQGVKNSLKNKGLLVEDQGARVVLMPDNMPPCLIEKTDGASLYATRDIASAIYRFEHLKAQQNLYVVGNEQKLHFRQVFCVLKKMGFAWASSCRHIAFGRYRFKDKRLSSREGQMIRLQEVLGEAFDKVLQRLNNNPDLTSKSEKNQLAQQIAYGAVMFNDLKTDCSKDVEFDWGKILSLQGDTGPYVQYAGVRCQALINKYAQQTNQKPEQIKWQLEAKKQLDPIERRLVLELLQLADVLEQAFQNYKPHLLAQFLINVCKAFNQFYAECKILSLDSESQKQHRMALVQSTFLVLRQGLRVLNIQMPARM